MADQRTALSASPYRERLPRVLGLWSAVSLVIGLMIGSGIYRVPSVVAVNVETVGSMLLLWVLGGFFALCGAASYAELATLFPRPGGTYVFLREIYGDLPGFLAGWTGLLLTGPASMGAIALIFAGYLEVFFSIGESGVRAAAAGLLVLLAALNYRSVVWSAVVINVTAVSKALALFGFALLCILLTDRSVGALASPPGLTPATWTGFALSLVTVMYTYSGWAGISQMAGEIKRPGWAIPRAIIGGVLIVMVIYLVVNVAYLHALTVDEVAASSIVAAEAASRAFGTRGAQLVAILVMLSIFGALSGSMMRNPRTTFAMAENRHFFSVAAAVHPRFQTPHVATAIRAGLAIAYVYLRSFEQLAALFILGSWPFHTLAVAGIFILRKRHPDAERPYRTIGYPVVPLIFLTLSIAMMLNALIARPRLTAFGYGIVLLGVPVFFVWRRLMGPRAERRP